MITQRTRLAAGRRVPAKLTCINSNGGKRW